MNLQELQEKVEKAYNGLEYIITQYAEAARLVEHRKHEMKFKEAGLLLGDTIDGKNQAIRDAQLLVAMEYDSDKLFDLEQDEYVNRVRKEVAEIQVAHARALLRIAELMEVKDEN
jgi:hypothetical protein